MTTIRSLSIHTFHLIISLSIMSSSQLELISQNRRNTQIERQLNRNQKLLKIKWNHFNIDEYEFSIDMSVVNDDIYQIFIDKILIFIPEFNDLIATKLQVNLIQFRYFYRF